MCFLSFPQFIVIGIQHYDALLPPTLPEGLRWSQSPTSLLDVSKRQTLNLYLQLVPGEKTNSSEDPFNDLQTLCFQYLISWMLD